KDINTDPVTDPTLATITWRAWWGPDRPEQQLMGSQFVGQLSGNAPYVVTNSTNWVYTGTGFHDGDSVPGIVGYEADRQFTDMTLPTVVPGSYVLLSHSPVTVGGTSDYSNSAVYQATSGAWVFASGTMSWSWALDDYGGRGLVDSRIQKTTANVLNRFVGQTPDFALTASPGTASVVQGGSTSYAVTIAPSNGFSGAVDLSVSGLPAGASGSFSPTPATTGSTLNVTVGAGTTPGSYPLTITGASGSLSHTTAVTLVVTSAATPDFSLSASPVSASAIQGASTTYAVTITSSGGFSGAVDLSVSGVPAGASGSFSPTPATTSSTLTVTVGAGTAVGSYPLTITGVNGALSHTASVSLVVTAAATPDFSI